jgi:hypothetical protein
MDESVICVLDMEQYKCLRCGRYFYIHKDSKASIEFDFGCPYGCDDSGWFISNIRAKIIADNQVQNNRTENKDGKLPDQKDIYDYRIIIILTKGDFELSMGRKPKSQEEFDRWAELAEKGLLNGHIDWSIIYACAKDFMPSDDEDD